MAIITTRTIGLGGLCLSLTACSWFSPLYSNKQEARLVPEQGVFSPAKTTMPRSTGYGHYTPPGSAHQIGEYLTNSPRDAYYETGNPSRTPVTTRESIRQAYSVNNTIAAQVDVVKAAKESYIQARASALPHIELGGSLGYVRRNTNSAVTTIASFENERETASVSAGITQPIYDGGNIRAQKQKAKAGITAAELKLRSTQADIFQKTTLTHMSVLRDQNITNLYRRSVDNLYAQKKVTDLLLQYGEATSADAALVDARLKSTQIQANAAYLQLEESRAKYGYLTGRPAENLALPVMAQLPASLQEAIQMATKYNPEFLQVFTTRDMAQSDLKIAKSSRLPQVSLDGTVSQSMGQSDLISSSSNASVSMNIRVPFSLGGEYRSKIRQATHALSKSELDVSQAYIDLSQQVTLIWNSLQNANAAIHLSLQEIQFSELAYKTLQEQFRSGVATQSELLYAENALLSAGVDYEMTKYAEQKFRIELLTLIGRIDGQFSQQADLYVENFDTAIQPRQRLIFQ